MSNTKTNNEQKQHPHAHWIKLWADGVPIEYKAGTGQWVDVIQFSTMTMPDVEYRIKPSNEPWKPKEGEKFFYLDKVLVINSDNYNEYRHTPLLLRGNFFRTSKEAKAAVPRVESALKGDSENTDVEKLKVWITENDIAGGLQLTVGELKERFRELSKENEQLKITNVNLNHEKEVLISKQAEIDGVPLDDEEKQAIRDIRESVGVDDGFTMKSPFAITDGENALIRALREASIAEVYDYRKTFLVEVEGSNLFSESEHIAFFTRSTEERDKDIIAAIKKIKAEQEASRE